MKTESEEESTDLPCTKLHKLPEAITCLEDVSSWNAVDIPYLLIVPDFPGLYRKYKPCPGVPNVCSKILDFDGPG